MHMFFKGAGIALAAFALSACDSDSRLLRVPVQVIHAVANAPSVDVTRSGNTLFSDVEFKQATGYDQLLIGPADIAVAANLPGDAQATVIEPERLQLRRGNRYSIIAAGSVGSADAPVQSIVLSGADSSVAADSVRVQVVHAAAGAPPVDIHVTGPMDMIVPANAIAGGNTPFGASSNRITVPAGDYRIRVTLPGATDPVFDSGTVALPGGADLVVLAVDNTVAGRSDGTFPPITLLVADGESQFEIFDAATPADVRVAHAVSDFNGVDIYVNDPMAMAAPAIAGLDFPNVVPAPVSGDSDGFIEFAPGTLNVLVTQAGNPGVIGLGPADIPLEQGKQYTVFASNTLAAGIEAYITEDDTRSIATEARVRLIHLSPAAGLVDIHVTEGGSGFPGTPLLLLEDIPYGANTGYLGLAAGSYDVTVTAANGAIPAIGPATITVDAGGVYTAVARDGDTAAPITPDADALGLILLDDF